MELRQLKYFVAVAEEEHFLNASRKMLVSQPALSQQIKLLEDELGVDLFVKAKRQIYRKVELTEEGKMFFIDAKKILQLCDKAKTSIQNRILSQKALKLGVYHMLTEQRLLDTLALFSKNFPDIDVSIVELPSFLNVQEAVLDESLDFGITVLPLHHKDLDYISLKKSLMSVIMHKNNPLSSIEKLQLHQLHQERWVEITASFHPIIEEIEKLCIKAGFNRRPHIVQEVSSLDVMAQLVNMGKGIAFIPSFYDIQNLPNIVNKTLDDTFIKFEQCLVFRKNKYHKMVETLLNG